MNKKSDETVATNIGKTSNEKTAKKQQVLKKRKERAAERKAKTEVKVKTVKANLNSDYDIPEDQQHLIHVVNVQRTIRLRGKAAEDISNRRNLQSFHPENFKNLFKRGKKAEADMWNIQTAKDILLLAKNGKALIGIKELEQYYSDLFNLNNTTDRNGAAKEIKKDLLHLRGINGLEIEVSNIIHYPTKLDLMSVEGKDRYGYSDRFCEEWGLDEENMEEELASIPLHVCAKNTEPEDDYFAFNKK